MRRIEFQEDGTKECTRCRERGTRDFFHRKTNLASGYDTVCIKCRKAEYRWRSKSDGYMQKKLAQSARYHRENQERVILCRAKSNAKKKGIEFSLEIEDIQIPEYCPLLGVKLTPTGMGKRPTSASIDRIDSARGYVKGNVRMLANQIKTNADPMQIQTVARNINEYVQSSGSDTLPPRP